MVQPVRDGRNKRQQLYTETWEVFTVRIIKRGKKLPREAAEFHPWRFQD